MKLSKWILSGIIATLSSTPVLADWEQGNISEIHVISNGNSGDGILVLGNFTPATGCQNNGFMIFSTDPYFSQSYALLLSAQISGLPIKYVHVYCLSNGYSRGGEYAVTH